MSPRGKASDITIVPFLEDLIEQYMDLSERNDSVDPLYAHEKESRDVRKEWILRRMRSSHNTVQAQFLALRNQRAVGSVRAVVIPGCGGEVDKPATMSLMVSPDCRGIGIGTQLLDCICKEMESKGVNWIEIGIMDSWESWKRFLSKRGFKPCETTADVVLRPIVPVAARLPETDAIIREIRLPDDREEVLAIFNGERSQDLPKECAVLPGRPAWWEVGASANTFDPNGFLVAEDRNTGELVGYICASVVPKERPWGIIDYLDVTRKYLTTNLRARLLLQVIAWLRGKGAMEIRSRVHIGYRDEEKLFEETGFVLENSATVWRRPTAKNVSS